jgi:dTDP-4-amino-4,6-dideoxygalactose transaminase
MAKIPITRPVFGDEEREALVRPLDTGWVVQGPFVLEFERRFEAFTGAAHAVASTSCTTALHLAVTALGLKPGDEVIVPAFTWVATPNVIEYAGAKPVFCDIDLRTFNIDPARIEELITPRTVGIMPVHLFGLCAPMDEVLAIAKRHRLWVVEDAACGFGAWQRGRHAGTFGDAGAFSFHPRKAITTGEGGMLTTGRGDVADLARSLRDHGASKTDLSRHTSAGGFLLASYNLLGFNYRMTDFQGALGCAQMDRAPQILDARRRGAAWYDGRLANVPWLARPFVPDGDVHGYQSYVTLFQPELPTLANVDRLHEHRNAIMSTLEAQGIATRQGSHAPVVLGYYSNKYELRVQQFPNAVLADRLTLTLPLYADITENEQEQVVEALSAAWMAVR